MAGKALCKSTRAKENKMCFLLWGVLYCEVSFVEVSFTGHGIVLSCMYPLLKRVLNCEVSFFAWSPLLGVQFIACFLYLDVSFIERCPLLRVPFFERSPLLRLSFWMRCPWLRGVLYWGALLCAVSFIERCPFVGVCFSGMCPLLRGVLYCESFCLSLHFVCPLLAWTKSTELWAARCALFYFDWKVLTYVTGTFIQVYISGFLHKAHPVRWHNHAKPESRFSHCNPFRVVLPSFFAKQETVVFWSQLGQGQSEALNDIILCALLPVEMM